MPGPTAGEVHALVRRVVAGDRRALLGLDRFGALTTDDVFDALAEIWGWTGEDPAIDPGRTLAGIVELADRLSHVAARAGRVAFATARPASLLALHGSLAALAGDAGADVAAAVRTSPFRESGAPGRRVWWVDGVAALTDGAALLAAGDAVVVDELLFELGRRPDLVVADGVFAGAAARAGLEVVALAGPGSVALGLAATRHVLSIVPLDETQPPVAYEPVVDVATRLVASRREEHLQH